MARGTTRAPSQHAYRGALGRTQTATAHITGPNGDTIAAQVHTTVDAVSDPDLAARLHAGTLNTLASDHGEPIPIPVPVLYHDPAAELMVLVLADAHRHRELDERIRVLERMRDDSAPIPTYAKDFTVVYGGPGLRDYVERRATEAAARAVDHKAELEKKQRELEKKTRELAELAGELDAANAEIERLRREARVRVLANAHARPVEIEVVDVVESTSIGPAPEETRPVDREEMDDVLVALAGGTQPPPITRGRPDSGDFESLATGDIDVATIALHGESAAAVAVDVDGEASMPIHRPRTAEIEFDDETTGMSIVPQGSDPVTTETVEKPVDVVSDPWLDKVAARDHSSVIAEPKGAVRLALIAGEQVARGLGAQLDVRVLLHRAPTYPIVTVVVGPPAALRVPSPSQLVVVPLDIALDAHRAVLTALARAFELQVHVIVRGKQVRRVLLTAPLAENVGYIMRAAEDHLRNIATNGSASYERGRDLVMGAGYDLLGTEHPDCNEFRDDKLAKLETAQHLRRAIAMARRFARPAREDYLVTTRGFPLPRWRELRRHVLESAVAWGLWMGPELAHVAVSEGLARSRRDLIVRLDAGFEKLRSNPAAFDIDPEAAEDNTKAIAEEARALGVDLSAVSRPKMQSPLTSEDVSQVSGSIGGTPPAGMPRMKPTDELIAELEDRHKRVAAAMELCDRADARAAAPVIAAVAKMSRAEAVRVLGMSVKFGEAAAKPLADGLGSSKGFLRHGCALALALLRTEDGTQAVIDLLLNEPTEIWREVARAIGQVGPQGLLPLAANYGRLGERATSLTAERVAWAMAHIAVRGGKAAVETMANGQSIVAPVARHALQLHASAANDQVRVRSGADGSQAGKDVTVNRAFSRRFFEALEQGLPDAAQAGLEALEQSGPMELIDEADVVEDDDEAELDESDLIQ